MITVTVGEFMSVLADRALEFNSTFSSGLWKESEVIGYIDRICKDFVLKSQVFADLGCVSAETGQRLYDDPDDSMQIDRLAFSSRAVRRTKRYVMDQDNPAWRDAAGRPTQYHQDQLSTKTFEVNRAPTSAMVGVGYTATGSYGLLRGMSGSYTYAGILPVLGGGGTPRRFFGTRAYSAAGRYGILRRMRTGMTNFETVHTRLSATLSKAADDLPVPSYCHLYVRYGTLALMFAAQGEGQDLAKAKYCGDRYVRGINLFRGLIGVGPLGDNNG